MNKPSVFINGHTKESVIDIILTEFTGRAVSDDGTLCLYKDGNGNRCAVGLFIPKGHRAEDYKGYVGGMLSENKELIGLMPFGIDTLRLFQYEHDCNSSEKLTHKELTAKLIKFIQGLE